MLCAMPLVRTRRRNVLDRLRPPVTAAAIAIAGLAVPTARTPAFAAASPWSDHEVVAVRWVASGAEGGTALLGLHFRLAPEWHVYWKYPGDAGAAPEVELTLDGKPPPGVLPTEIFFPAPRRFALPGGLEAIGYQGEVVYPVGADIPGDARGRLHAVVDYVACAIECIPYHDELEVTLDPANAGDADEALLRQWLAKVPRARAEIGLDARLRYSLEPEPELEIELVGPPLAGANPELFLEPPPGAAYGPAVRSAEANAVLFRAPVLPETAGQPPPTLRVAWTVAGLHAAGETVAAAGQADVPAATAASTGERTAGATSNRRGDAGATSARRATLIAALSIPALLLAVLAWTAPSREERVRGRAPAMLAPLLAFPDPLLRSLGFLAAAALVWIGYRLALLLPATQLAGVQLSWLGVALAIHSATRNHGARRIVWIILAAAAAALAVWLA